MSDKMKFTVRITMKADREGSITENVYAVMEMIIGHSEDIKTVFPIGMGDDVSSGFLVTFYGREAAENLFKAVYPYAHAVLQTSY